MGWHELQRCWQTAQQLIDADGIFFNGKKPQAGNLSLADPIPLVIGKDEWPQIERAIVQRATLLNHIVADAYKERRLLHEGCVPPALIFANPQFLRPCDGTVAPAGVALQSYSADLARSPDGRWWVLADYTQAPSGIGYILANRLVSTRALSRAFSHYRVRQLARFFDMKRDALLRLARTRHENPRVVLMTSGQHNETHIEYSFLAGRWGFPLVSGADLTVRDGHVYLKTLSGLEPVGAMVRGLDDSFCDPLELRSKSLLGVPGLVQAVRNGTVVVDNALGSGLGESSAFLAFLPGLCRHLLGQDLLLPSVATWWCGQSGPRRYVLEHLDELVIKAAFPGTDMPTSFPQSLDRKAREELARAIEAAPDRFVAQEQVALSTAPVLAEDGIVPSHIVLRVFAAWDGESYQVLPGGLTRVSAAGGSAFACSQSSGTKDTWVLGEIPATTEAPLSAELSLDVQPIRVSLPSGVAENLYWLGRYTERIESRARLVRALLPALRAEEDVGHSPSLDAVLHILSRLGYLPPEIYSASLAEQLWGIQRLLSSMVYDRTRTSVIGWNLEQLQRVARQLKECLSPDTWRVLQQVESDFSRSLPADPNQRNLALMNLLDTAIITLSAFAGLVMENMTRGEGWRFLEIGRRLERTLQLAELLRCCIAEAPAESESDLRILLHVADSSITYRNRYFSLLRTDHVLELLLTDESNPRSVSFQLAALGEHIQNLPKPGEGGAGIEPDLIGRTLTAIREVRVKDLCRLSEGSLEALAHLLRQLTMDMYGLSDALTARYVRHVVPPVMSVS
jgi:uncharacterized circularly permuted ATP-grasp superfamily protein/uncharacterized alpha-E superfamily protein